MISDSSLIRSQPTPDLLKFSLSTVYPCRSISTSFIFFLYFSPMSTCFICSRIYFICFSIFLSSGWTNLLLVLLPLKIYKSLLRLLLFGLRFLDSIWIKFGCERKIVSFIYSLRGYDGSFNLVLLFLEPLFGCD